MPQAGEDVSAEHPGPDLLATEEGVLQCVGSVHDSESREADAGLGDSDMHQDLLHIEASFMSSNTTPVQKDSINKNEQERTHPLQINWAKKADSKTGDGKEADDWSVVAERSQRSDKQFCSGEA
jgi:hypothetical protein